MKRLGLLLATLGLSCGPPPPPACCRLTVIAQNFGYVGSYASDAGVTTQVQLVLNATGGARLSFVRGGHEVVETLTTLPP